MVALHPGNVISDVARTLPRWIQYLYRTVGLGFLLTPLEGSDGSIHASIADDLKDGASIAILGRAEMGSWSFYREYVDPPGRRPFFSIL